MIVHIQKGVGGWIVLYSSCDRGWGVFLQPNSKANGQYKDNDNYKNSAYDPLPTVVNDGSWNPVWDSRRNGFSL